ncbi:MAG: cation diffusion facilitator family transporter [Acidobacteria bacterium]|nr:cation diffusion facilitator family transporter [Acidobacteriota bacterium]
MNTLARPADRKAERDKTRVAAVSVGAAILLTGGKLVVGLATGSLGVLSEALHSGLDLAAALVTWLAVRVSDRPADQKHTYGHGKIENLSALFEVLLLILTCAWIMYEALSRLTVKDVEVDAAWYAFAVVVGSIAIDVWRSRALRRVARKYRSQALEADALHFSTDVWSSLVVLVGLAAVAVAPRIGWPWLRHADAVAALGVAMIVIVVGVRLARRAIDDLIDAVPPGLHEELFAAVHVPGVLGVEQVRVRHAGPRAFVDVILSVPGATSTENAHGIASAAEEQVRRLVPHADVLVHVDPGSTDEGVVGTARRVAGRMGLWVHGVQLRHAGADRILELHLEVPETLSVGEAHERSEAFETALREALPDIDAIHTHLEPVGDASALVSAAPTPSAALLPLIERLADEAGLAVRAEDVQLYESGGGIALSIRCTVERAGNLGEAHDRTEALERHLRERVPRLGRVVIHVEPAS